MLKEFRVSNYKSISNEQIFTMEACPQKEVSEHPGHVITIGDQRLLKVSSFYGPNGGGKTTLINAIITLFQIITSNRILTGSFGNDNYLPHVLCSSNKRYSCFDLFFVCNGMEIGYSLIADLTKTKRVIENGRMLGAVDTVIIKEEMSFRKLDSVDFQTLFIRNKDGIVSSSIINNIDLITYSNSLPPSTSFIKYVKDTFGASKTNQAFDPIFAFEKELSSISILNQEDKLFFFTRENVDQLTPHLKKTTELLNGFDIRIKGLRFVETEPGRYCLYVVRETAEGKEFSIQLPNESKGTIKAINIIFSVLSSEDSPIFIADDFDSHLHPKVIRTIIGLFTSDKNKNKQLIINSHDIINMNNQVFRRDEIWFAYRDESSYSTVYTPLSSIEDYKGNMVRKDAVYGKQYLEGKYGADPFVMKGLEWSK